MPGCCLKGAIFTEAGDGIGFGHFSRCSGIYYGLKEYSCEVDFYVDLKGKSVFSDYNLCIKDWRTDYHSFSNRYDVLVIDSYYAQSNEIEHFTKISDKILIFDDYNRINYPSCATVINPPADKEYYTNQICKNILYGSQYICFRRGFWNVEYQKINSIVNNVVVSLGSFFSSDVLSAFLLIVRNIFPSAVINVIGNIIDNTVLVDNNIVIYNSLGETAMKELLLSSDIGITAGGQTLLELGRCGIPSIIIMTSDNQLLNINMCLKDGLGIYAGKISDGEIYSNLECGLVEMQDYAKREAMSNMSRKIFDGKGALRVAKLMCDI